MRILENTALTQISPKDYSAAQKKLQEVEEILKPYLVDLTPEERKAMPKMSDRSAPFVEKVNEYANTNPELGPAYLDIEELEVDIQSVRDLNQLAQQVHKLRSGLGDTVMRAGSEAYVASLAYYNSVKGAAKLNVPGAKLVYDDLKAHFENRGCRSSEPPTENGS